MGKTKLVDMSQPFGHGTPLWPYFPDVKIERFHYHAKSGVLTQWITAPMHCSTHADSPNHKLLLGNDIMGFENVGGDIDQATGMRCTIAGFPIKWVGGDGSMVRLVAIIDSSDQ